MNTNVQEFLRPAEQATKVERAMNMDIVEKLKEFMDNEARSCSMDYGGVTPIYVYRMWGGQVPLNEIESAMNVVIERMRE